MSDTKLRILAMFLLVTGVYLWNFDKVPFGPPWAVVCLAGVGWCIKILWDRTFD